MTSAVENRDHPLLMGLPSQLRGEISNRLSRIKAVKGRTLVERGAHSTDVLFLVEGRAEVIVYASNGREVYVNTMEAGDVFGEISALDGHSRSASVVAVSNITALTMRAEDFMMCIENSPVAAVWLARRLASSVRRLTENVFELSALNVQTRVHCELLRLAQKGEHRDGAIEVRPALTHAELANRIGTHREAVTREMQALSEMGIIRYSRGSLTILSLSRLEQVTRR